MSKQPIDYTLVVTKPDETGRICITSPEELGLIIYAEPDAAFADVRQAITMLRILDSKTRL